MSKLFFLLNHCLTEGQRKDAFSSLGVNEIVTAPPDIRQIWSQLPADTPRLTPSLEPIFSWLKKEARCDDFILIQGDSGAVYLLVNFSFR